ncbi:MAG: substrate-binding domain-containing protein [Pirellulales bacterium]|nr:substrate-binding domain-containing protein [Pirellulales bacterium]
MINGSQQTPTIHELAMRLEQDIRGRGLREGQRYMNTVEAGHTFGVSPATAHRAMKLLVERNMVVRRNRSGTFIGPGMRSADRAGIHTVHFLTSPEKREYLAEHSGSMIRGFSRGIPKANVQFGFVPAGEGLEYVKNLLNSASVHDKSIGFVCSSCPFDIHQLLADEGIPTVVSGTLPLGGPDLPSVALDDFTAGQLLAKYLVEQGHRRIGLLATTLDRPGDKRLFDGIGKSLSQARLLQNSLVFHIVSQNASSVALATRHLLEDECRPTAIIARSERLADMACTALKEMGLSVPDDIEVVFLDHATDEVQRSPLPHVQTTMTREEAVVLMSEMLLRMARGESLDQKRVVIPVELCNARTLQT